MNKTLREHIEGAVFYVTSRADGEGELFKDEADYASYALLLKKYKMQYGFKLFAFALLPTHLHLLIELKPGLNLSDIMHDLNANYTKYFNSKYQKKGHLFQERSKIVIAEKESHLLAIASYIHLNPKALNKAGDAKDYVYSSYPLYLNMPLKAAEAPEMAQEVQEALSLLKGRPLTDVMRPADMDYLAVQLRKKYVLGGAGFAAMIEEKSSEEPKVTLSAPPAAAKSLKPVYLSGIFVAALLVVTAALVMQGMKARKVYKEELARSNVELDKRLVVQKAEIARNLEEKYRADQVSYQAMSKRLEIEKKRNEELQKKAK